MTICPGESVTFSASGGLSYRFLKDNIEVQARGTANTYSTTLLLNNEAITVEVFDAVTGGCSAESEEIVIVYSPVPVVGLSSTAVADTFCTNDSITFTGTSNVAGSQYEFFIGNTSVAGPSTTASFTSIAGAITDGSTVTVVVTTPAGCSSTATLTMIENQVSGGVVATASSTICINDVPAGAITINSSTVSGTASYQWQYLMTMLLIRIYRER